MSARDVLAAELKEHLAAIGVCYSFVPADHMPNTHPNHCRASTMGNEIQEWTREQKMAQVNVKQFAEVVGIPVERLIAQLGEAGLPNKDPADVITEDEKVHLLSYLRKKHEERKEVKGRTYKRRIGAESNRLNLGHARRGPDTDPGVPPDVDATPDGTEYEDTGITRPFNPTLINILTKQMSLDTLIKRIREGEVNLAPDFQRSEVWRPTAKSRLIESLLIRIPLPAFYMDATDEDNWLVVDGLQRLSTLRDFVIAKTMKLQDLEFLTHFHGRKHDDLPRNYQRRIEETQVTVYLIEKGTPPEVKFNIFKRINTGGLPLTAQEIRHALNQGPVTAYLKRLADSDEFQHATSGSVSDTRMAARECVLRFMAFTLTPPATYKAGDFDAFLSDTMGSLNRMSDAERDKLADRFIRAVKASYEIFQDVAFRKPKGKHRSAVNKALFEVWTVTMDEQTDQRLHNLKALGDNVTTKVVDFMRKDSQFLNAISEGTGDVAKVRLRFHRFRSVIEEALP